MTVNATNLWRFFKAWFARIGLALVVLCLVLAFFHILELHIYTLVGIFAVLVCALYEIALDIKVGVEKLLEQIAPFKPQFHLGERVEKLERLPDKSFRLTTELGKTIEAKVVVVAAGGGSFESKKPRSPWKRTRNTADGSGWVWRWVTSRTLFRRMSATDTSQSACLRLVHQCRGS